MSACISVDDIVHLCPQWLDFSHAQRPEFARRERIGNSESLYQWIKSGGLGGCQPVWPKLPVPSVSSLNAGGEGCAAGRRRVGTF